MTGPNDGSDEFDRPKDTPENPDQHMTDPDQHENDAENPTREVRTDGGEVVTDPGQHAHQTPQPHGPETPAPGMVGRSQDTHTNPARPTESTNSQTNSSPTNLAEPYTDSETTNTPNADQLFSGAVSVDDVVEFYLDTNPWDVQPNTVKAYKNRLKYFQEFCAKGGIEDLGTVQPKTLDEFQNYLHEESSLEATSSIKSCLAAFRKFLQYCERRGVFDHGFHKLVILRRSPNTRGRTSAGWPERAPRKSSTTWRRTGPSPRHTSSGPSSRRPGSDSPRSTHWTSTTTTPMSVT